MKHIHDAILDALRVHHARTGEIADPKQLAAHITEAISDDLVRLAQSDAPMVCDHEGHMIPHTVDCPDRSTT